eukprot:c6254_g1_i2.p1 GENE.c6254_g1_i2~~c6254_g1_i2.p1  ORF type:complete len:155 (+),score=19.22 c6254_g1_i2:254-718(+)
MAASLDSRFSFNFKVFPGKNLNTEVFDSVLDQQWNHTPTSSPQLKFNVALQFLDISSQYQGIFWIQPCLYFDTCTFCGFFYPVRVKCRDFAPPNLPLDEFDLNTKLDRMAGIGKVRANQFQAEGCEVLGDLARVPLPQENPRKFRDFVRKISKH